MPDMAGKPTTEYGCALAAICLLVGVIIGAWWGGRGAGDRVETIERSQERIRARLYEIDKKIEEASDAN